MDESMSGEWAGRWTRRRSLTGTSMARLAGIAFASGLAISSCATVDDSDRAIESSGVEADTENPSAAIDSVSAVTAQSLSRIGLGRAESATSSGDSVLVGTTTGVYARSGAGGFFEIPTLLGSDKLELRQSSDGERAILIDPDGRMEIWHVDSAAAELAAGFEGVFAADFLSRDSAVVVTAAGLVVVSTVDGEPLFRHAVPTVRDAASLDVAGTTAVVAITDGPEPVIVRLAAGEPAQTSPIPVPSDSVILRLELGPDDDVTITWHPPGDDFSVSATRFAFGADTADWTQQLDIDVVWDLAEDNTLLIGEQSVLRVINPDGSTGTSTDLRDLAVRWVFAHRESAALYATVIYQDGLIEVFDADAGTLLESDETGRQIGDAVRTDSGSIVAVDGFGMVRIVDDLSVTDISEFEAGAVNDVAVSLDGQVAAASRDGKVRVVNASAAAGDSDAAAGIPAVFDHPQGNVDSVAFAPDGRLATGVAQRRTAVSFDDSITVWSVESAAPLVENGGEAEPVGDCSFFRNVVAFSPQGDVVLSLSHDFTVQLLDSVTGDVVHVFPPHGAGITDMAVAPDGGRVVTAAESGSIRVWNLDTYELDAEYETMLGGVRTMAFLPSGDEMLVSDLAGSLFRLDLVSGDLSAPFESSKPRDARIAVSPDGRLVASGSSDGVVRLWSIADGTVVGEFEGHRGAVTAASFDATGAQLVTGSDDGTAIIWELAIA